MSNLELDLQHKGAKKVNKEIEIVRIKSINLITYN